MDRILAQTQTQTQTQALGAALRERRSEIARRFTRRLRTVLPEYYTVESAEFQEAGWAALTSVVEGAARCLQRGDPTGTGLSGELVAETLSAARNGLPWEVLDRTYHLTHQLLWETVFPLVAAARLRRDEEAVVLRQVSDLLFDYFDHLTIEAGRLYARARSERVSLREQRLAELVRQALDGASVTDEQLAYRLRLQHVAVVGWGRNPLDALAAAARTLDAELLTVPAGGSYRWAWLGRAEPLDPDEVGAALAPGPGTRLGIGSCQDGRTGFVASHHEARLACSLLARRLAGDGQATLTYPQVALEAAGLDNESTARTFVEHVLRPLRHGGARAGELRETLLAYSAAALSTQGTARLLGVAERTVRYRLARLDALLGPAFRENLPSLVLAIRLERALELQARGRAPGGGFSWDPSP